MNNKQILIFSIIYLFLVSLYGICICVLDKKKAKEHAWRVSEKHIFIVAFLGGALAEYCTMKKIHHKTLHKRFMLGLPLIILLHVIIILALLYFLK